MSQAKFRDQEPAWRTSSHSMGGGECVEVAANEGKVLVRDSKNRLGSALAYPADAWQKFLSSTKQF